jgi:glycerol uptake operon antiterminator
MNEGKLSPGKIICAVRSDEDFASALISKPKVIFDLSPDISDIRKKADASHKNGKKLFIHIDLATGIGKDKSGILYAKECGVDGIISTRGSMIKAARELGIFTVQRFFIVDSQSLSTTKDTAKSTKPDMIEIMPGLLNKTLTRLSHELSIPVIAGGLIECEEEVNSAIFCGAVSVSTGKKELWDM